MPTYEFRCLACGHRFERFLAITAEDPSCCPVCGGAIRRLPSPGAGLIFRGSGFHATDYRSKSYRDAEKRELGCPECGSAESCPVKDGADAPPPRSKR